AEAAVRHRWLEGSAGRYQRGFRRRPAGAALPCAQVAQRARSPSRGAEGTGEELDAGSLEDGSQGGHEPHPQAGRVAGTRVSFGCIQPAGGAGGMLHHQPAGCAALIATLPGDDQHHREPACRSAHPNPPHHKLAKWLDGEALDGLGFPENGEELPQDHGLSRTLDAGGDSERIAVRHSTGCGVVTSTQPPLGTFNYARDILQLKGRIQLIKLKQQPARSSANIQNPAALDFGCKVGCDLLVLALDRPRSREVSVKSGCKTWKVEKAVLSPAGHCIAPGLKAPAQDVHFASRSLTSICRNNPTIITPRAAFAKALHHSRQAESALARPGFLRKYVGVQLQA